MKDQKRGKTFCKIFIYTSMLSIFILLSSCITSNVREYIKGNVEASAQILSGGKIEYGYIRIGTPQNPLNQSNKIAVKLRDIILTLNPDLSPNHISQFSTSKHTLSEYSEWGANAVEYYIGESSFIYSDNKLVSFTALRMRLSKEKIIPEIGISETGRFYALPLNQQQIEDLFGKPDKIWDKMML